MAWWFALMLLGTTARGPHLEVGQLELEPFARVAIVAAPPRTPAGATLLAPRGGLPAPRSRSAYIGDTWSLGRGRELSLHLTPNEGHCAPLMRLTF